MSQMSTETETKSSNAFEKFDNDGQNYSTWATHCHFVLQGLKLWDVVNPLATTSVCPIQATHIPISAPAPSGTPAPSSGSTSSAPALASGIDEWDQKNSLALSQLST